MNNLELIRTRYPLIDQHWSVLSKDSLLPLVILAQRGSDLSLNISLDSSQLGALWRELRPQQELPQHFDQLARVVSRVVIDLTALAAQSNTVRIYAYNYNVCDWNGFYALWPHSQSTDLSLLGLYSDRAHYKIYHRDPQQTGSLIKDTLLNSQLITREWEEPVADAQQMIQSFGLDQLDTTAVAAGQRLDGSAYYLTVWNKF
jgi:hypothetical protein